MFRPLDLMKRLRRDDAGAVAVVVGVLVTALAGFIGVGVEIGTWYLEKNRLQVAADAAALAGGVAKVNGGSSTEVLAAATKAALKNGYDDVATTEGDLTVTAEVTAVLDSIFIGMLEDGPFTIKASATAKAVYQPDTDNELCILALNSSASGALDVAGSSMTILNGCGAQANSAASDAMTGTGNGAYIRSDTGYWTVGGYSDPHYDYQDLSGAWSEPATGEGAVADPYASVSVSLPGTCTKTNYGARNETLAPGRYCKGLDLKGNITLQPGTYYITEKSLTINATANVTGNGVTIVLANGADVTINGGATVNLTAPSSGTFKGLVIMQDRVNVSTQKNNISGNSSSYFNGTLYFPKGYVEVSGNSGAVNKCTHLIADTIALTGNSMNNFYNQNCSAVGVDPLNPVEKRIVLVK